MYIYLPIATYSSGAMGFQIPCGGYLLWVGPVQPLTQYVGLQGIALVRLLTFPVCCLWGSGFVLPS